MSQSPQDYPEGAYIEQTDQVTGETRYAPIFPVTHNAVPLDFWNAIEAQRQENES